MDQILYCSCPSKKTRKSLQFNLFNFFYTDTEVTERTTTFCRSQRGSLWTIVFPKCISAWNGLAQKIAEANTFDLKRAKIVPIY